MSITKFNSFKIIEEKALNKLVAPYQLSTLLLDMSMNEELTKNVTLKLLPYFQEVTEERNWSFLSAYDQFITPERYVGLAFVEWVTPENPTQADAADYCVPIIMSYKQGYSTSAAEALEEYIFTKAKSQQALSDLEELFNEN